MMMQLTDQLELPIMYRHRETILIDQIYNCVTRVTPHDLDDAMCTLSRISDLCEDFFRSEDPNPYAGSEWAGGR